MVKLFFDCRYCAKSYTMMVKDGEALQDGAHIEGICEECFDQYQKSDGQVDGVERVPCPVEIRKIIEAFSLETISRPRSFKP